MRTGEGRGLAGVRASVGVLTVLITLTVALACGDDESLNQFGAEGAHQYAFELELGDDFLALAGDNARSPVALQIVAHSDVTIAVRNAGDVEHELTLYGGPAQRDPLASTGPLAPGMTGSLAFHFHDAQSATLRDSLGRNEAVGTLLVEESAD
jgi:hypothetical protein